MDYMLRRVFYALILIDKGGLGEEIGPRAVLFASVLGCCDIKFELVAMTSSIRFISLMHFFCILSYHEVLWPLYCL